jgi:hypothetical protein
MAHIHQQIRDYVATRIGEIAMFSGRVYKMRDYALDDAKLPAAVVYTNTTQSAPVTIGLKTARGELELTVELHIKGASLTVSDDLDAACALVENVMGGDFDLGGLAKAIVLSSTAINVNVEGAQSIASVTLVYSVEYVTVASDVETAR